MLILALPVCFCQILSWVWANSMVEREKTLDSDNGIRATMFWMNPGAMSDYGFHIVLSPKDRRANWRSATVSVDGSPPPRLEWNGDTLVVALTADNTIIRMPESSVQQVGGTHVEVYVDGRKVN